MALGHVAAVRNREEGRPSPNPRRMHADREPDISRPPQGEHAQQAEASRGQRSDRGFACIPQMDCPEEDRHQKSGWPESNAGGQRRLQIASKRKLLEDRDENECDQVEEAVLYGLSTPKGPAAV